MSEAIRFRWERAIADRGPMGSGSANARAVGKSMAEHADAKTGEMYPGIARLVKKMNVSERTVTYGLKVLRETGWIERVRKGNSRAGMADVYRLTIPAPEASSDHPQLRTIEPLSPARSPAKSERSPAESERSPAESDAYHPQDTGVQQTIEQTIEQQTTDQAASGLATDQANTPPEKERTVSKAWSDEVHEAFRQGAIDEAMAEGKRRIKRVLLAMETSTGEEPETDQGVGVGDEPWTDKEKAKIRSYQGMGMNFAKACEYVQKERERPTR